MSDVILSSGFKDESGGTSDSLTKGESFRTTVGCTGLGASGGGGE